MAEHGGYRPGAGRPPGQKNKTTAAREALLSEALKRLSNQVADMSPLDLILAMMREAVSAGDAATALNAATIALPYTAPRLAPVVVVDPNAPTAAEIAEDDDPEFMDEPRERAIH